MSLTSAPGAAEVAAEEALERHLDSVRGRAVSDAEGAETHRLRATLNALYFARVYGDAAPHSSPAVSISDEPQMSREEVRAVVWGDYRRWKGVAVHEAAHAVAFAAEGRRVTLLTLGLQDGKARCDAEPPVSALVAVSGEVGAAMLGHRAYSHQMSRGDREHLREAAAREGCSVAVLERQARAEAHDLLAIQGKSHREIAEALMTAGELRGAELDRLLEPVRQWGRQRAA